MNGVILSQMGILFALIALGFLIKKLGILGENANFVCTKFIMNVALPANIVHSAMSSADIDTSTVLWLLLIVVCLYIALPILSFLITKVFRMKERVYRLMLTYGNIGFMGIPILSSVFGEEYVFVAAVVMLVFNLHLFSVGIVTLEGARTKGGFKPLFKKLCTPAIIASILAVIMQFIPPFYPEPVVRGFEMVGGITTPLAMILIGSQLAGVKILSAIKNYRFYIIAFFKLIVFPLCTYTVLSLFMGVDNVVAKAVSVEMGLPVASTVTMICIEYKNKFTDLAAEGTAITTILSLGTIPLILILMN